MNYMSFDNMMDSSDDEFSSSLFGQVTYIPSFRSQNDTDFTPMVAMDQDNLYRLYFENSSLFSNVTDFVESLEQELKSEFGLNSSNNLRVIFMTNGEVVEYETQNSRYTHILENTGGDFDISEKRMINIVVEDVEFEPIQEEDDVQIEIAQEIVEDQKSETKTLIMDKEMEEDASLNDFETVLRDHSNLTLALFLEDFKTKEYSEISSASQLLNLITLTSINQFRTEKLSSISEDDKLILSEQIEEKKDHMVVAMNILLFFIRNKIVSLSHTIRQDNIINWNITQVDKLISQSKSSVKYDGNESIDTLDSESEHKMHILKHFNPSAKVTMYLIQRPEYLQEFSTKVEKLVKFQNSQQLCSSTITL